jgi:hypothetical protein
MEFAAAEARHKVEAVCGIAKPLCHPKAHSAYFCDRFQLDITLELLIDAAAFGLITNDYAARIIIR